MVDGWRWGWATWGYLRATWAIRGYSRASAPVATAAAFVSSSSARRRWRRMASYDGVKGELSARLSFWVLVTRRGHVRLAAAEPDEGENSKLRDTVGIEACSRLCG